MNRTQMQIVAFCFALFGFRTVSEAQVVDYSLFQTSEKVPSAAILMSFVHAVGDVPAVRIDIGDTTVVPYLRARDRTEYLQIDAQPGTEFQLRVFALSGGLPQLFIDMPIFSDASGYSTAILLGNSSQATVEFTYDTPFDGEGTFAWVSSFNGIPAFQGFDVFDRATGEGLLFSGYFGSGHPGGIAAGTYDLEVRPYNSADVVLTLNHVVFEPGRKYILIFCPPLLDGESLSTAFVLGARFRISSEWRKFDGNTGFGARYGSSAESAEFWFFSPTNIELVAKVIDGSPINESYWVFMGALSNVQFTLTVFDMQARVARQYFNSEGVFASFGDIEAFPAP